MTYCESCEGGHCEQFSNAAARLKRVKLADGTLSLKLEDISVVQGEIKDCPLKIRHDADELEKARFWPSTCG
jgi:hypothetical protein